MAKVPKVAVLLAGCGHLDGAEIREAVLTLLALDQHGAQYQCLAPNAPQFHVVNHLTGEVMEGQSRNMLEESCRIARVGKCLDLAQAKVTDFEALLIPGGYGVAKNHCDFAFKMKDAVVREDVAQFVQGFFEAKKPVGAICIAPALVALILAQAGRHPKLTIGNDPGTAQALESLGARHEAMPNAREISIDEDLKLVTSPAYMFGDASLSDLYVGIERTVGAVLKRV